MTVENAKEGAFGPVIAFLTRRFHNVKNDRDSVLVVVSNYTLICVRCIARDYPILPNRALSLLEVGELYCVWVWVWGITKQQCVYICDIRRLG